MTAQTLSAFATAVLIVHLGVVAFNIFGLIVIPLGAWRRWPFVRRFGWRAVHLGFLGMVAVQALAGRACFLTDLQALLLANAAGGGPEPLIQHWINHLLYWPLPFWVFTAIYVAVVIYAVALWRLVPPHRRGRAAS